MAPEFGGAAVERVEDLRNTVERYTPSYEGWSTYAQSNDANFSDLSRAIESYYASGNGLYFASGGRMRGPPHDVTDWYLEGEINAPGLVMYNESSQDWYNISTEGFSSTRYAYGGAAHFVTEYGPEGLLLLFGGYVNGLLASFDEMYMFEPVSQQWRSQVVSGEPPPLAYKPCVVGVRGDNGTYEVSLKCQRSLIVEAHLRMYRSSFMVAKALDTMRSSLPWP